MIMDPNLNDILNKVIEEVKIKKMIPLRIKQTNRKTYERGDLEIKGMMFYQTRSQKQHNVAFFDKIEEFNDWVAQTYKTIDEYLAEQKLTFTRNKEGNYLITTVPLKVSNN